MCPVSYLMLSGYLSNSGTKSKERLACAYGGWSWQRNGLTLPPFWLESCPCKITPAGVWKRESFCIFLKCYCHSTQRNISHFKFEEYDSSLSGTLVSQTGDGAGAHVQKENQLLANVSCDCFHDLSSRMSRVQGPTPPPAALLHHPYYWKKALTPLLNLPSPALKIITFLL